MNYHWKPTVLLVEDDPGDQELTRRALEEVEMGGNLEIVSNGEEALDYLFQRGKYREERCPDLVLLDLNLPRVDGRQVLRELHQDPRLQRMIVVVMTTSDNEHDIANAYELGAKSYIVKPVGMQGYTQVMQTLYKYWFNVVSMAPRPRKS